MAPLRETLASTAGALLRPRIAKLCILTTGRSGSDLLVELLDAHPRMRCEKEPIAEPKRDARRFIHGRVLVARLRGAAAYGFKINSRNLRNTRRDFDLFAFVQALGRDGFRFVRLQRENRLRQVLSTIRADQIGRYHATAPIAAPPIHVDPAYVVGVLGAIDHHEALLELSVQRFQSIRLVYEDDLESPERRRESVQAVCSFVGLEPSSVESSLVPTTPRMLADVVENHAELVAALRGTKYERFLFD